MKKILFILMLVFAGSLYADSTACQSRETKLEDAIAKQEKKISIVRKYIQLAGCYTKHHQYQKVINAYNTAYQTYVAKEKRLRKRFNVAMSQYMAVAYFNLGEYGKSYNWSKIHFNAGRYKVDVMKLMTSSHFKQHKVEIRTMLH